jgi:hypothetical protein
VRLFWSFYEIENVNRGSDIVALVGFAVFIHCVSYVVLQLRLSIFRGKSKSLDASPSSNMNESQATSPHDKMKVHS